MFQGKKTGGEATTSIRGSQDHYVLQDFSPIQSDEEDNSAHPDQNKHHLHSSLDLESDHDEELGRAYESV